MPNLVSGRESCYNARNFGMSRQKSNQKEHQGTRVLQSGTIQSSFSPPYIYEMTSALTRGSWIMEDNTLKNMWKVLHGPILSYDSLILDTIHSMQLQLFPDKSKK